MKWEQVRSKYPHTWVLAEAVEVHSDNGKRIIEDIAVLDTYTTGQEAMRKYIEVHKLRPEKELFIYSTANEKLEIKERVGIGIRGA